MRQTERTFVYTFPKRERCYTSGVDALRSRCRPIDFAIWEILIKGFQKRTKPTIW